MQSRRALHPGAVLLVLSLGCEGAIGGGPAGPRGAPEPIDPATCTAEHAPLRRLSRDEYLHTVRDLFEGQTLPALQVAEDPEVQGFSNHHEQLAPSPLLVTQYNENAVAIAQAVSATLAGQLGCGPSAECFETFVRGFGERAFRRPLESEEVAVFASLYTEGPAAGDFALAVELAVQAFLQSPDFLYRPELGVAAGDVTRLDDYEVASRLSYLLWSSMPDEALLTVASTGALTSDRDALEREVDRMIASPRARNGVLQFFGEWLEFDAIGRAAKSPEDNLDPALRASIRESAERFVWDRVFAESGTTTELFTSSGMYVDARLAELVGYEGPVDGWTWVELDPDQRAGILTHPVFLAAHGYAEYPSPVLRGGFVLDRVLCSPPSPPPMNLTLMRPEPRGEEDPPRTNREAYAAATTGRGELCASCHNTINSYGFAFEGYDTMGRHRTLDDGLPVDASGEVGASSWNDAVDLTHQLANSEAVASCVVDRFLAYAGGGGPVSDDPCIRADLERTFESSGGSVRSLVVALAVHPRFVRSEVVTP